MLAISSKMGGRESISGFNTAWYMYKLNCFPFNLRISNQMNTDRSIF